MCKNEKKQFPLTAREKFGTLYPKRQAVYTGSDVRIYCYSLTNTTWTKDGHPLSGYIQLYDSIMLPSVQLNNSGIYKCYGTYDDKQNNLFISTAELLVGGEFYQLFGRFLNLDIQEQ